MSASARSGDSAPPNRTRTGRAEAAAKSAWHNARRCAALLASQLRRHSRFSIALALLALNAIAITTVFIGLQQLYDRDIREAEIRSQNLALAIDLGLSHEISKIDLSLRTVIAALDHPTATRSGSLPQTVQNLVRQQRALLPETEGWSIVDAAGRIIFHEGSKGLTGISFADRPYFRTLKSATRDALLVTPPLTSWITGNPIVLLARAIRHRDGGFAGIVAVPLPVNHLRRVLQGFEVGRQGALTLRDSDLRLVTRIRYGDAWNVDSGGDSRVSATFARLIAAGKTQATFQAVVPFDQTERVVSYRLLSDAPLYAVVTIAKEEALSSWRQLAWRLFGLLGLFLLVTNGSAALLIRQWRQLQRDAGQLRESNARLESSLSEIQGRDKALIAAQEAGGLGTYTLRLPDGIINCSEKLDAMLGIDADYPHSLAGWQALIHEDEQSAMMRYFSDDVVGQRHLFDREYRVVRPSDGKTIWVHGLGKLDLDDDGDPVGLHGTIRDISERKFAEERLHLTHEIFQSATEGILVTDREGTIIETNPAFSRITGYSSEEAIGQNPRILKSGEQDRKFYRQLWKTLEEDGTWEGEFINLRKNGERYIQHSRISALRDAHGTTNRFTGVISDVTALKETQRQLEHMAYYDELTGLPNRVLLTDRMRQAMARCRRKKKSLLGVCYLDLDGFKAVNDQWGHAIGDQLLVEAATRLNGCTRSGDTVARLGGDEFIVLFCDLADESEVEPAVARLMAAFNTPCAPANVGTEITISVGVTIYPYDAVEEPDALIRHADQAMYEAKRSGKNRMRFFDPESDRRLRDHQQQHDRLVEAVARDELRLFYQPKVDLRTGAVVGVEALIRWQHPELGLLQPSQFLPSIEATELTLPIGEWILHEALQQKQRWQRQDIDLCVSVNIFGLHLQRTDFSERLAVILQSYPDVAPAGLELEILETTALEDLAEITQRIRDCTRLGVRFSLDDFGTGYSSLSYLRQLPVAHVKIDRSFVRDLLTNREDQALVQGIVSMAHALQRQVIAEGVETIEHGVPLLRCGCDLAQGYGIARPMPPEAVPDWLAQWRMPERWNAVLPEDVLYFGGTLD